MFLWKYNLLKPGSRSYFEDLLRADQMSHDELEEQAWMRTQLLLRSAYSSTDFYRRRFSDIGLDPRELRDWSDFEQIPVLTRDDLVEHFNDILATNVTDAQVNRVTTGGSTGHPVTVCHPKRQNRAAALWRMKSWWNIAPDSDWGTVYRGSSSVARTVKDWVVNWPSTLIRLDASSITREAMRAFVLRWNQLKPPLLHGYVGGLQELAEFVRSEKMDFAPPRVIWSTSAPLSNVQRETLESNFGGTVYDQYGCCEVYYIAAEGPEKHGLRIFNDIRRVEIVGEDDRPVSNGEQGDVLITDLENLDFPLIRYRNGDRCAMKSRPSDCAHPYSLMEPVRGRISEKVRSRSGQVVTGEYLTTLFDECPKYIRQFQVHQHEDYSVTISVVSRANNHEVDLVLEEVRSVLSDKLGGQEVVRVQVVPNIDHDRGKLRFITSDL